jgi:hypothetical protein
MPEANPITAKFPMAQCDACHRSVLTYVALDDAGAEQRLCVHCDGTIAPRLEWVSAAELESLGYSVGSPAHQKACGCGGSCSRRN